MAAQRFVKLPVEIEAIQLTDDNAKDVCDWIHSSMIREDNHVSNSVSYEQNGSILVTTLEGVMRADVGDWIIRGVKGEFYPCKPDIFAETYRKVVDEPVGELAESRKQDSETVVSLHGTPESAEIVEG